MSVFDEELQHFKKKLLRKHHLELHKYYWKRMLWAPSYFASSCGGAPISIIRQYIEQQDTPS